MRRLVFALAVTAALLVVPVLVLDVGHPDPQGNLAARAGLATTRAIGPARDVVEGPVAPEGSTRPPERRLLLGTDGALEIDLGGPVDVGALFVVAESDDRIGVETSLDAVTWTPRARVAPVPGAGLRARELAFEPPVRARHLRLSNAEGAYGDGVHLNAVRVYPRAPERWPDHESTTAPAARRSFPWLDTLQIDTVKVALACAGAVLFALCLYADRLAFVGGHAKSLQRALVAVTVASTLGWWNFLQLTDSEYMRAHRNYWDFYNYYIGSKYSDELGYENLYRCMLAADLENGLRVAHDGRPFTRDLATNAFVPTAQIFGERDLCKERFAPERWAAFQRDQSWFQGHFLPSSWQLFPRDHGYNPSPAWTLAGRALGNLAPMSESVFVVFASIDTVLLAVMWYAVFCTFGWLPTCGALVFWSTNLVAGNFFTAGAYLRHDWLVAAALGVCALRRGRAGVGGFLLAYAAMLRLFPAFLLGGVALAAIAGMVGRRSFAPSKEHVRIAIGAAAALVAVGTASVVASGRTTDWPAFFGNTRKHATTEQIQNVGLRALAMHVDKPGLRALEQVPYESLVASYDAPGREVLVEALAALFLPLLALAVWKEESWVAAILGTAWLPFVHDVSNYYWSFALLYALLVVRNRETGLGFAALIVAWSAFGWNRPYSSLSMFTYGSLALVLYAAFVVLSFARPKLDALRAVPERGAVSGRGT